MANRQYLEDGLGAFLVVRLGLLHSWDEGQFLQVLQDGEGGALLGQLLAVAFTLGAELADGDARQEALHVRGAALLQHLRFFRGRGGQVVNQGVFFLSMELIRGHWTRLLQEQPNADK